jgi:SAM-dependent methyltransferase
MNPRLQPAQALLRRTRLLPLAQAGRFAAEVVVNYPGNRRFAREHPDFTTPPAHLAFDAYANLKHDFYRTVGTECASEMAAYVHKYLDAPAPAVLEWGCGCARVLRHLPELLPGSTIAGSDYNAESIDWCRRHIPGIRFELNELAPPLPFEDGEFDFVFGISVLTHLSEKMHFAWFDELRRVTRPGGLIAVSVHGEALRPQLLPPEIEVFERGELVVRDSGGVDEGKRMYLAFQPDRFMRERLLADCEVLEHVADRGEHKQDLWVVRRT